MSGALHLRESHIVPILQVSSVSGENLSLLTSFLNMLPPGSSARERERLTQLPAEFALAEHFDLHASGVGFVVAGLLEKGVVQEGDTLCLGPDAEGRFVNARVHGIHRFRLACRVVQAGQAATIALRFDDDDDELDVSALVRRSHYLLHRSLIESDDAAILLSSVFRAHVSGEAASVALLQIKQQLSVYVGNVRRTSTLRAIEVNNGCDEELVEATCELELTGPAAYLRRGDTCLLRHCGILVATGRVSELVQCCKASIYGRQDAVSTKDRRSVPDSATTTVTPQMSVAAAASRLSNDDLVGFDELSPLARLDFLN